MDYTDFVRALVAEPVDGGVTFTPRHKVFSLMGSVGQELLALGSSAEPVLILDEINRGDIANIFRELLYALEYRDEAVATPYTVDGHASITVPARPRTDRHHEHRRPVHRRHRLRPAAPVRLPRPTRFARPDRRLSRVPHGPGETGRAAPVSS